MALFRSREARFDEGVRRMNRGDMKKAFELFLEAAKKGHAVRMHNVAVFYFNGQGVEQDGRKSAEWEEKAAWAGYLPALAILADKYYFGQGIPKDLEKSLEWTKAARAAEPNNPRLKKNVTIIEEEIRRMKDSANDPDALIRAGYRKYTEGNYSEAFAMFLKAAQLGDTAGMNNVSICYFLGQGVEKDVVRSFEWIKKAAEGGYVDAFNTLATRYRDGVGTGADLAEARKWALRACQGAPDNANYKQTLASIENILGRSRQSSDRKVSEAIMISQTGDWATAIRLFQEAADEGNATALYNLALVYGNGWGVDRDRDRFFSLLEKAADLGHAGSCNILINNYISDIPGTRDPHKALRRAERLAEADSSTAASDRVEKIRKFVNDLDSLSNDELAHEGGELFKNGDFEMGFQYSLSAAEKGSSIAMNNVGVAYCDGEGVEMDTSKGLSWLEKAAAAGNSGSMVTLAMKYRDGENVRQDTDRAVEWLRKALETDPGNREAKDILGRLVPEEADEVSLLEDRGSELYEEGRFEEALAAFLEAGEKGSSFALYNASVMYKNGEGTRQDLSKALEYMKRSAELGDAERYYTLIEYAVEGLGMEPNLEKAREWLDRAIELDPDNEARADSEKLVEDLRQALGSISLYDEAVALHESGDDRTAFRKMMEAAEAGNADVMHSVSIAYYSGLGVEEDPGKAFEWMCKSAEAGSSLGRAALATYYEKGIGTRQDLDKALEWARAAAQTDPSSSEIVDLIAQLEWEKTAPDDPTELVNRGMDLYTTGKYDEAIRYFTLAAEKGDAHGLNNLSVCYANGQGVNKDPETAFSLMEQAAQAGLAASCMSLAMKYRDGDGTDPDPDKAMAWARKAVELEPDNENFRSILNRLEHPDDMSNPDRVVAEALKAMNAGEKEKGFKLFKQASEMGSPVGMFNLAVCYANGIGTRQDTRLFNRWMNSSAEMGYEKAMQDRFDYRMFSGPTADVEKGLYWAEKLFDLDPQNETYMNNLEYLRTEATSGRKVTADTLVNQGMEKLDRQDYDGAFELFERAARTGHPVAMNNLSVCYAKGWGTEADRTKAFEWMKKSAEAGYSEACRSLSVKYFQGDGTERDPGRALTWIEKAIEIEPRNDSFRTDLKELLGLLRHGSPELVPDREALLEAARQEDASGLRDTAFVSFLKAAMAGSGAARFEVYRRYKDGEGTETDLKKAEAWLNAAAKAGDPDALNALIDSETGTEGADIRKALADLSRLIRERPEDAGLTARYTELLTSLPAGEAMPSYADDVMNTAVDLAQKGDVEKGLMLLERAAEMGSAMAKYNLSECYERGEGFEKDEKKAFELLREAADLLLPEAFTKLADRYGMGYGVDPDMEKALYWTEKALEAYPDDKRLADNAAFLKERLSLGGTERLLRDAEDCYDRGDYAEAFASFTKARELGSSIAMNNVSFMYYSGLGIREDRTAALEWMKKAAEAGYAPSCYSLAIKYWNALGTPRDTRRALQWAQKACSLDPENEDYRAVRDDIQNSVESGKRDTKRKAAATFEVGVAAMNETDYARAFPLFMEAAQEGMPEAMHNVGFFYDRGYGVAADPQLSFQWIKKAAEAGFAQSAKYLADKYYRGDGTEKDLDRSLYWMGKASRLDPGNAEYKRLLFNLKNEVRRIKRDSIPVILTPGSDPAKVEELLRQAKGRRMAGQYRQALIAYETAGKAGHYLALRALGDMYYTGGAVNQDYNKAVRFYTAAAYRGDLVSRDNLARKFNNVATTAPWKVFAYLDGMNNTDGMLETLDFKNGGVNTMNGVKENIDYLHRRSRTNTGKYAQARKTGYPDAFAATASLITDNAMQKKEYLLNLKLGALLGHTWCLVKLGEHYATVNREASKRCYQEAAKRGHRNASIRI